MSHELRIEFDSRHSSEKWQVICSCGFNRRAKKQLDAEEIVDVHKHEAKIKPAEAADMMSKIFDANGYDNQAAHSQADALLCKILVGLGYQRAVEIYSAAEKWYA